MGKRTIKRVTALNAQEDVGFSSAILVSDYQHISFNLAGANTSALTVKIQGAISASDSPQPVAPDFTAAQALGNEWDYVDVIDYEDGSSIDGDTGVVFAADDVRQFTVNVDGLDYISFHVSAHTTGDVTARVVCYNNQ